MAIVIPFHGEEAITIEHLVLDFTGTLSKDGRLLPGVAERLIALSSQVHITVLTEDTRGTAREQLSGLPVEVRIVGSGKAKGYIVSDMMWPRVAAIGNGANDVAMLRQAALGIAVLGDEGTAGALLRVAAVVAPDIISALDLLADPIRLLATLRA